MKSFEALVAYALLVVSFCFRIVVGKPTVPLDVVSSLILVPVDVAIVATSFTIVAAARDRASDGIQTLLLVIGFLLLVIIYYLQVCTEKRLQVAHYGRMGFFLFVSMLISICMLVESLRMLSALEVAS